MTCDIYSLPLEILEKILSNLEGESLIQASQVCWTWFCVAQRMMAKFNRTAYSAELLEDIGLDIQERLGSRLYDVYRESIEHLRLEGESEPVEVPHSIADIEADGKRVFLGDGAGNILEYRLEQDSGGPESPPRLSPEPFSVASLPDGPVVHLGLMRCRELLVAVSPGSLHLFSTAPTNSSGSSTCLMPVEPSIHVEHKNMALRVQGDLIGVTQGASHLVVLRVTKVEGGTAQMEVAADFTTPCGIYRWKIWNNQVMCVLKTGSLVVWDLGAENFSHVSEPYNELRYQNPCWMFQRYVLCSSELSRNLLCRYIYMMPTCPAAYWHISCGPAYWLFGRLDGKQQPEPEKYRGVLPPDVTAMCLRRRVLACARRSPNEVLLYLMPRSLPHDREALTEALTHPLVTLRAPGPVTHLEISFLGPRLLVFTGAQGCLLHCFVLTREELLGDPEEQLENLTTSSEKLDLAVSASSSE